MINDTKILITIGQEVICPDGLGRIKEYFNSNFSNYISENDWVIIETYYPDKENNNNFKWQYNEIELIDPRK